MAKPTHVRQAESGTADSEIATGLAAQQAGNWAAALAHFRHAADLDPMRASTWLLVGDALARLANWQEAVEAYRKATSLDAAYADAHNNLGIALLEIKCEKEAVQSFANAIGANPNQANAYFNLGKILAGQGQSGIATELFTKAIAIEPAHAYAHHELGNSQEKMGFLYDAAHSYRRSVELDPTRTVRVNLAAVLTLLGDPLGPEQLEELMREQPFDAESHWNLAMGLLLHGNFRQGWQEYEWRTEMPRFHKHHHRFDTLNLPRWRGENLDGKAILLYGEQGHGDTLQFLRYVPAVVERGGRVILEVLPLLKELLRDFPGIAACISPDDPKPQFSVYAPLMSLPWLLDAQFIPPPVWPGVLNPQPLTSRRLKVGLAWSGNPDQKRDHLRSIPLEQWNSLGLLKGVSFTALQMGPSRFEPSATEPTIPFVADCFNLPDFASLAAVIAKQDLVISVDTAVAHLAGTMGKPLWILLPLSVDWRWGLSGDSTPWYPNAKLFRQKTPGSWTDIMNDVSRELAALIQSRGRHTKTE